MASEIKSKSILKLAWPQAHYIKVASTMNNLSLNLLAVKPFPLAPAFLPSPL